MKYPFWLAVCCIGLPLSLVIADSSNPPPGESYQPADTHSGWNIPPNPTPAGPMPYPENSGQWRDHSAYQPGYQYGSAPGSGKSTYDMHTPPRHYNFRPLGSAGWQGAAPFDHYAQPNHPGPGGWTRPPVGQWRNNGFSGNYPGPGYGYGTGQSYGIPYGMGQAYGAPYGFGSGQSYNPPYPPYGYRGATDYGYPPPPSYAERIAAPGYGSDLGYGYGHPSADYSQPYHSFGPGPHAFYRDLPDLPIYPSQQLESEYGLPWTTEGVSDTPLPVPDARREAPAGSKPPTSSYEELSKKYGIPPAPGQGASAPYPPVPAEKPAALPAVTAPEPEEPDPLEVPAPAQDSFSPPPPATAAAPTETTEEGAAPASPSPDEITAAPAKPEEQEPLLQVPTPETAPVPSRSTEEESLELDQPPPPEASVPASLPVTPRAESSG